MKIAVDISPLSSEHKVRGIGFYVHHLKSALEKYFSDNSYLYFTHSQNIPKEAQLIHYPYFDPFFLTLPLIKKKKTVVTVHDLTPLVLPTLFPPGMMGKVKWFLQKQTLKKVDAIITDSYASKEDIERIVGFPNNKIHVAYLAAGEEFKEMSHDNRSAGGQMSNIKKKYSLPDTFALYVGDVTPNKNLPRVVKAALRANIPLVMVGKALVDANIPKNPWTKDIHEVQELAKKNNTIIRLGFVQQEELVALYNTATLFVMPSLYEGFGLPVLEAMSCGCPVITSQEGSLKEITRDSAYIVDPYSIESIAEAIQKVVGDKQLQKKLREKGLIQSKKFSWKKTAEETATVYKKVLSLGRI